MNATEKAAPKTHLNSRELARELGISSSTVRHMTQQGRIPCIRISERTRRYDLAAVLAALAKGQASA